MAYEVVSENHRYNWGADRARLPVREFYTGSGNSTVALGYTAQEICYSNDSTTQSHTVTLTGNSGSFTIVLLPLEVFDERVTEFKSVTVVGTGNWRFYCRVGELG